MKIRILDNTLRIRFSQTELNSLSKNGVVKKEMIFPKSNKFIYSLNTVAESSLTAEFIENEIKVHIPAKKVDELVNTDLVGVENNFSGISILVEKDFKCLTERKEDETELFENPLKSNPNC